MKSFAELPVVAGSEEHHCWLEFGEDDELGCLNRISPAKIVRSAGLVRAGKTFALSLPLDEPGTGGEERPTFEHRMIRFRNGRDDALDNFYMSSSSQWDGLRHVRFREHGYYGGRDEEVLDSTDVLGIQGVAERGIVTRGVLLDIPRFMEATGQAWDSRARTKIGPDDLDACLEHQSTALEEGDVMLLRTGWLADWQSRPEPERVQGVGLQPGLDPAQHTAEWLWDHGVAAVAADNMAVEPMPLRPAEDGFLHYRLLALLGMLLGEQFDLEKLASDCADDRVYDGLFVSGPLMVPGGVCSPPNAYLIK
jgi:Putative cyclase